MTHGDPRYNSELHLFDLEKVSLPTEIQTGIEIWHCNHHAKDDYWENNIDRNEDI